MLTIEESLTFLRQQLINMDTCQQVCVRIMYMLSPCSRAIDLWLEYIKTLTLLGSASEVSDLYWRATKTLDGRLIAQFMSEHSCLKFS